MNFVANLHFQENVVLFGIFPCWVKVRDFNLEFLGPNVVIVCLATEKNKEMAFELWWQYGSSIGS